MADGKTERLDLRLRNAGLFQDVGGGLVGHAEKIAGRAEPRGIDGDGIGDDGDETERALGMVAVNFLDDVGINGIGGDDAIRLRFVENVSERVLEPREAGSPFSEERGVIQNE